MTCLQEIHDCCECERTHQDILFEAMNRVTLEHCKRYCEQSGIHVTEVADYSLDDIREALKDCPVPTDMIFFSVSGGMKGWFAQEYERRKREG